MIYQDRHHGGRVLAAHLKKYAGRGDTVVLALPRGGVPVAFEVARALSAPLDVFVVRKLGFPGQEELAIGAIASGGVRVLNDDTIRLARIPAAVVEEVSSREGKEVTRRELAYRGGRPPVELRGKTVIVVDDGLATGATMRAAVSALRRQAPARIVVAVPTAAEPSCAEMESIADECVCPSTPYDFRAVGCWYEDFNQTSDEDVRRLLAGAASEVPVGSAG
jgi:predicted phosphoribosyltransferase